MDYVKMCANSHALLRKSTIVLMLLTALCAVSCKTVKNAQQTALSQRIEQNNDLTQHTASETLLQTTQQSSDTGTTDTEVDEVIEETTWSAPDSTGTQHPVKTTKTNRHTSTGKRNNVHTTNTTSAHAVSQSDVNDNSKVTAEQDEKTSSKTSTKTSTPAWLIALIIGVIAAAVIVILVILRHYRII